MPRLPRIALLLSLCVSIGAPVALAPQPARAGGLVRPATRQALVKRRQEASAAVRRTTQRAQRRWKGVDALGRALVPFGPAELPVFEREIARSELTGVAPAAGARLIERLLLVKVPARQVRNARTRKNEQTPERYQTTVELVQVDGQGYRQSLGRYTIGTKEEVANGEANYSVKQFAGLLGAVPGKQVSSIRARTRQAQRNWHIVRRLARELRSDLRPDEEVFLAEATLAAMPGQQPVEGQRVKARLLLVNQPSRAQVSRYNPRTGRNEYVSPHTTQIVLRARQVDAAGNLVQEIEQVIGGQSRGMTDLPPAELTELLGGLSSAALLDNANRSLTDLLTASE